MEFYTIKLLSELLANGQLTSVELVSLYLERIKKYDAYLRSVGEINPKALTLAKEADERRKEHKTLSKLDGIPILIKDNINYQDDLHTTAGSLCLKDFVAASDAFLVKKLKQAGLIVLGKTNMSEFAYFMASQAPSGYSGMYGQCVSPYDALLDPVGSSTGSAVAVSAGLIPIAIGTETNGSLMAPARNNQVVSLKPTLGMISRSGIIPISITQDTAGPMTLNVEDCAILMDYLYGEDEKDAATLLNPLKTYNFQEALKMNVKNQQIGFLSYKQQPYTKQQQINYQNAKEVFEKAGVKVVDIEIENRRIQNPTLSYEFKRDINAYLSLNPNNAVKDLADIIELNKKDPANYMKYGQDILERAQAVDLIKDEKTYLENKKQERATCQIIEQLLEKYEVDVLVSFTQVAFGAIGGYPTLSVPAPFSALIEPCALIFIGNKWQDERLFAYGYLYEQKTKARVNPDLDKRFNLE